MKDTFIFTMAYNCGMILDKCLESFFKYHDCKVHILGRPDDFKPLKKYAGKVEFMPLLDGFLKEHYKHGHQGTAYIWTEVLLGTYTDCKKIIQFDSDVIFFNECISDIEKGFENGYDLIGPRRAYKNNQCNREDVRHLPDVVSTYFIGVNKEKINVRNYTPPDLQRMVAGLFCPEGHSVIDFFDPISFEIIKNGGKIKFLDKEEYGSMDADGNKENSSGRLNSIMDFGTKLAHFAGIGSGMNFHINGNGSVPITYTEWAKKRYYLYMKLMHNEDMGEYDQESYSLLIEKFNV